MTDQRRAYAYVTLVVFLWATSASAFKISLRYLDFLQLLFFASITSIIILFAILILQKKLTELRKYSKKDYLRSAILGFLNPFFYYIVLFKAYSLLSAQRAVALNYTWPIMIVLLSIPLLRQRIGGRSIVAIIISYSGALIISTQGNIWELGFADVPGVLLALGSAVIWALSWIYNIRDQRDEAIKLFLNFVFGSIFICITYLVSSRFVTPALPGLIGAIYVGTFEMGITFILWLKALKLSKTTVRVSNLIYIAPFLSLLIINLVVGEKILASTIIGLTLIVSGILIQQYPPQATRVYT